VHFFSSVGYFITIGIAFYGFEYADFMLSPHHEKMGVNHLRRGRHKIAITKKCYRQAIFFN